MEKSTIQQRSPLDTLVRRASSRRARGAPSNLNVAHPTASPRHAGPSAPAPAPAPSPLLHTHFRTSTTTFADYDATPSDARSMLSYANTGDASRVLYAGYDFDDITSSYRESYRPPDPSLPRALQPGQPGPPSSVVPTVVVSPEQQQEDTYVGVSEPHGGRAPSRVPVAGGGINFSRPGLPTVDRSDERKRQVLARNQNPSPTPSHSSSPSPAPSFPPQQSRGPSPSAQLSPHSQPPASPTSLYSSYSYYPPEAIVPSPTTPTMSGAHSNATLTPNYVPSRTAPSPTRSPTPTSANPGPRTAQEFLQLGIQHHEANRLVESAACFEKAATVGGGCGVGMLMWGLAQRHGWGCTQSERAGFKWLRRAAEVAVVDLEGPRQGVNVGAVKSELTIAVYEVGQSFYRGWGVEKDKKMAVNYYRLAARMGDPDAQQELAFCLANGKGCKKDKREAAKWYRAAVAQGASDIGLAWIYKEKYQ